MPELPPLSTLTHERKDGPVVTTMTLQELAALQPAAATLATGVSSASRKITTICTSVKRVFLNGAPRQPHRLIKLAEAHW